MNKSLHDIDDLFRSALDPYEEVPSAGVKKSLEAALDKKDAGSYKRKLILWKRTALLLLLLLTGFVLYESGILETESGRSATGTRNKTIYSSKEKHEKITPKPNTSDKTMNAGPGSTDKKATKPNNDKIQEIITGHDVINSLETSKSNSVPKASRNYETGLHNNVSGYKKDIQKNKLHKELVSPFGKEYRHRVTSIQTDPVNQGRHFNKNYTPGQNERVNLLQSLQLSNIEWMFEGVANSIKQLQDITDSQLKNSISKNTKAKTSNSFQPFWMLTPFVSYERAGYRLDSDLATNITNIKHSEDHEPSFSLGILATRQVKKRWGLQTGLIYSLTDIGISPQKLYALQNAGGDITFKYSTSSGYAYIKPGLGAPPAIGDSLITTEGTHKLRSVNMPLVIKYSIGKNKVSFNPGVGIEANFLTSAKVETEVESPSSPEMIFINKLNGAKTFHLSVVADAELRYKINNKISASFQPAVRFAVSPITKNNVVETFPYSLGIRVGFTYKF